MARLMSVAYTADAVIERRKTVTRRVGWRFLKVGDELDLCRKVMGRKKGEPLERLARVRVVSVRRERLTGLIHWSSAEWAAKEMDREGFPGMDPAKFVRVYFTNAQGIPSDAEVTRIEWEYVDA
jgi:hypothetical protein